MKADAPSPATAIASSSARPATAGAAFVLRQATSAADLAAARQLFLEYQAWLGVELCFQGFAAELASLPGAYAQPWGRLLLAVPADERVGTGAGSGTAGALGATAAAGCVALRRFDQGRCEMKRLFVRREQHGLGLGRRLVIAVLDQARAAGYRTVLLDTLPQMQAAQRLYISLGFHDIEPYYHNPIPGARYLARDLAAT